MRKILVLLLCILLILSLCACKNKDSKIIEPVNFYYCNEEISYNSASGVIAAEIHEGAEFQSDAQVMLRSYLQGPKSNDYISLIPENTIVISLEITDSEAYIKLSDTYSQLSGIKLATGSSCIAMTLHDYTGVERIHFSTENELLDNKDEYVITLDNLVLLDVTE